MEIITKPTLDLIVSTIEARMVNGLKGLLDNVSYSLAQIESDVHITRNAIIKQLMDRGLIDINQVTQSINCIPVECADIAECCDVNVENALRIKVPKLAYLNNKSIVYLGTVDKQNKFKTIFGTEHLYNKYTPTKNSPYVWFSDAETGWLFNPPTKNIQLISIRAIFANPYDVTQFDCCQLKYDDAYPAPDDVIKQIIDTLVNQYVNDYRRLRMIYLPNNGQSTV